MGRKMDSNVFAPRIIKKENLILENKPILVGFDNRSSSAQINLKKEGNIIKLIEITCKCGNRIDIVCEYEDKATSDS